MRQSGMSGERRFFQQQSVLNSIPVENVYIACGYTDMRRSIDGLAAIVQQVFRLDPYVRNLYLFCGKRSDRLKGLLWEGDGFLLLYKRLECARFQWPRQESDARSLTEQQLRWLLEGLSIEQAKAVKNVERKLLV